jgi:hypothetical protein
MVTENIKRTSSTHHLQQEGLLSNLIQERLQNLSKKFVKTIDCLPEDDLQSLLTLSDEDFWSKIKAQALTQRLIDSNTSEKTEQEEYAEARQAFLTNLKKYGGVHKSSTVMKLLSVTAPTVIKYGKTNKLIVINWGADNLFPVFQFSTNEKNSEKGMLKGVPELLALITHNVSAVRKCNFFTRKIEMPGEKEEVSILETLQKGSTEEQMKYFRLLAKNFGTNNLM